MKIDKRPLEIFLDSNIYYQNRFFETPAGTWLFNLGLAGKIKILLPKVVESEIRSHFVKDRDDSIGIVTALSDLISKSNYTNKKLSLDVEKFKEYFLLQYNEKIDTFFENLVFERENNFKLHVEEVFEDYFNGSGAFAEKKKRDDIPDAFIYHSLRGRESISVVTNDMRLKRKLNELSNVINFDSLSQFLDSDKVKEHISDFENERKSLERKKTLEASFFNSYMKGKLNQESLIDHLTSKLRMTTFKNNNPRIPFQNFQIHLIDISEIPKFSFFKSQYLPDDTLQLIFKVKADCVLTEFSLQFSTPPSLVANSFNMPRSFAIKNLTFVFDVQFTDSRHGLPYMGLDALVQSSQLYGHYNPLLSRAYSTNNLSYFSNNIRVVNCELLE